MNRLLLLLLLLPTAAIAKPIQVGSKKFTEAVILGEITMQLLEAEGIPAVHRRELGGSRVLWNALLQGEIDIYPEYTGTLLREILAGAGPVTDATLPARLADHGIAMSAPLGFNNTYVLGMTKGRAAALGISTISALAGHGQLRFGFTGEFMERHDGWPSLKAHYGLPQTLVRGLDHDIAYRALLAGDLDVIDLYSTDAEIRHYDLVRLADDRGFFARYDAVLLYRDDLERRVPPALAVLGRLESSLDEDAMTALNAAARIDGAPEADVAAMFLRDRMGVVTGATAEPLLQRLRRTTLDHLLLVVVSLGAAIIVAVPLGVWAARHPRSARVILGVAGTVQTIPALALLVFLIPLLGIGFAPAIAALFCYSLLPIVRNTHAGLHDIPAPVRESAIALGLPELARLRRVELPLAMRGILAGVKTAAVINVGTATLGALIGAGGYGQPILSGIRRDDFGLILEGAVPAAVLALLVQALFDLLERRAIPRGLRFVPTR